jgi:hypothetical protein
MKLRIRGDSLRLRLKRSEVDLLAAGKSIVEETHFPGAVLRYRLDVTGEETMQAQLENSSLIIRLPASQISGWATTDEVSILAEQDLPGGDKLTLLVEKDFSCLEPGHHRDCEDDEDTFAHPSTRSSAA